MKRDPKTPKDKHHSDKVDAMQRVDAMQTDGSIRDTTVEEPIKRYFVVHTG